MVKMRIHQLAKEMGLEPKDFLAHLEKMGLKGKKAQGSLEENEVARVRAQLGGRAAANEMKRALHRLAPA